MLVRSGISAKDSDISAVRNEINAWFKDLEASLDYVPRANALGEQNQFWPVVNIDSTIAYVVHNSKEKPDFALCEMGDRSLSGFLLSDAGGVQLRVKSNSLSGPTAGIFILLFLDRSLSKEADAKAGNAANDIFAKR